MRVWRSGARARRQDVASAQDGGGALLVAGRGPGDGFPEPGRDAFLAAGDAALATKPASGEEVESDRLKAKLDEALIERDLLHEKIARLESGGPLARRRRGS